MALPPGFSLVDASFGRQGAQIPGRVDAVLAGPRAPGQVAATEADALAGEPIGEVVVSSPDGSLVMNQVHQAIFVGADTPGPEFLPPVDDGGVVRMFDTTLLCLPLVHGQENDYGTQEAQGGSELEEPDAVVVVFHDSE